MARPLLDIRDVTSGYGEGAVIQNLSLSLERGSILGLMGRNGVGKTTLLKTIMGIVKPRGGSIEVDGQNITGAEPYRVAASGIGYVPQGREILADFTTEENLLLGNLKASESDLQSIYKMFPVLQERASSLAGAFSGGQQQQLAIGRALMGTPDILLLDEPSEGIQPSIVTEIGQILKKVSAEQNVAIILVEQNIDMVVSVCERVLFMEHGNIDSEASVDSISEDPEILHKFLAI